MNKRIDYWNNYYRKGIAPVKPSSFAKYVLQYINKKDLLLDIGCGNGRDTLFFVSKGMRCIGIDLSREAIKNIKRIDNVKFFCKIYYELNGFFDVIYMRFFLHGIMEEEEDKLLRWCYAHLKLKGKLLIETRTIYDELANRKNSHFRRFIIPKVLCSKLEKLGFNIKYYFGNFSKIGNDNPYLMRVICRKTLAHNNEKCS